MKDIKLTLTLETMLDEDELEDCLRKLINEDDELETKDTTN